MLNKRDYYGRLLYLPSDHPMNDGWDHEVDDDQAHDDGDLTRPDCIIESDLSYAVTELRSAIAAEWAKPLPCSGMAALARRHRVFFAESLFAHQFAKGAA